MEKLIELKKQISKLPFFTEEKYARYRLLLVPMIVLVIAILISILVTAPQIFKLIQTYKQIQELNDKKDFYKEKITLLDSINVSDYRRDLDTALIALPVDRDIPGVIGQVLVTLNDSGMKLTSIAFATSSEEKDKASEYGITIAASGTETSLKNFLDKIRSTPRLIKLSSIQIDSSGSETINASLTFATFFQSLPDSIGSIDEKLPNIGTKETQILTDIRTKELQFPKAASSSGTKSQVGKVNPFSP